MVNEKGFSVKVNIKSARFRGKLKLAFGSEGKIPPCGTSYLLLLGSNILNLKSR